MSLKIKLNWLTLILVVALTLRLAYALSQDHLLAYNNTAGDSAWYLRSGHWLLTDTLPGPVPTAPLYLLFIGLAQAIFSDEAAIIFIRVAQALMGAATCYFAYRLATILTQDEHAGLVAAGVLAISPVFVIESAQILTETLYVFLVFGALLLYVDLVARRNTPVRTRTIILLALQLGLATLTRAVLLLFPLGLAAYMPLVWGRRAGLTRAAVMLVVYTLLVSIWTVHNAVRWNRLVIGAEGYAAFLYVGATGWQEPFSMDEQLMQAVPSLADAANLTTEVRTEAFTQAAANAIGSDPAGWVRRRFAELANAYFQPHGTVFFPGESLKTLAGDWLRDDRTISGLLALTHGDAFWPKLTIYLFHYAGLLFGLIGMWLCRRQWRTALPLMGFVLYTTLVHLPLLALPRYIFPTEVIWWVFASVALVKLAGQFRTARQPALIQEAARG